MNSARLHSARPVHVIRSLAVGGALMTALVGVTACGSGDSTSDPSPSVTEASPTTEAPSATPSPTPTPTPSPTGGPTDPNTGITGSAESGDCSWLTREQIASALGALVPTDDVVSGDLATGAYDGDFAGATSRSCTWVLSNGGSVYVYAMTFPSDTQASVWQKNGGMNQPVPGLGDEAAAYLEEMPDGFIAHWLAVRTGNTSLDIGFADGMEVNDQDSYADYVSELQALHAALTSN